MELEIKHVKGYLGYRTQMMYMKSKGTTVFRSVDVQDVIEGYFKLCLRNLSDLTKEIEHNGEKFVPLEVIKSMRDDHIDWISIEREGWIKKYGRDKWLGQTPYELVELLKEWHFDVFGLIPKNLAIDINTLK